MDGVTSFHVLFLSSYCSHNNSRLIVFLIKGKRVFHVSIFSLVHSGNGYASSRLSYGHASTYRPRHTYYVTVLVFLCPCVHTKLAFLGSMERGRWKFLGITDSITSALSAIMEIMPKSER